MSLVNIQTSSNISHPTARCPVATSLYFKWVAVAARFKKGRKPYESACLEYKWHVAKCAVCREGRDENLDRSQD